MDFSKQIDFLLANACISTRYLVYRDFLGASADEPFMKKMQEEILNLPGVKKHLAAQHPDGWFGYELHGTDSIEAHIAALLNLGVEKDDTAIQKGIHALITPEIASSHKNHFKGGDALDADGRGGNRAIIANILSWVKYPEDTPIYRDEIALAYEHLSAVLAYTSVDDFTVKGKNDRWYKPKARFPGANHIGLLEATESWRTPERMQLAKDAAHHAYELMKDFNKYITFKKPAEYGGSFVGPFNYNWQALRPIDEETLRKSILENSYRYQFGFWLGAVAGVPDWVRQSTRTYELLADLLIADKLMDMIPEESLDAFRRIHGREPSRRKKCAAKCDVTFMILKACRCIAD